MLSVPPGLNAMHHMEQCFRALAETTMTNTEKVTLLETIDDFVFGHALGQAAAHPMIDVEFARAQLATGAFRLISEVFSADHVQANKDRFERALQALLKSSRR
jgi:hypothetical protein